MRSGAWKTEPSSLPLRDVSVSAVLARDRDRGRWDVTVVLSRAPDQERVQGNEVQAQLLDEHGVPFKTLERPSGPLVEAGGSLGMSANAPFCFAATEAAPAGLTVTYRGQTVRFRVHEKLD
jgi:hypothetical protein